MKQIFQLLRTVRKEIYYLLGFGFLGVLLINFILPFFFNVQKTSWACLEVFDRIFISIISSFVFYLFVVHIENERNKKNLEGFILKSIKSILGDCSALMASFRKAASMQSIDSFPSPDEVKSMLALIVPNSPSPLIIQFPSVYANWIQYMNFVNQRTKGTIERLLARISYLDSPLVSILTELEGCSHFSHVEFTLQAGFQKAKNMSPWENTFLNYLKIMKELEEFKNKKYGL